MEENQNSPVITFSTPPVDTNSKPLILNANQDSTFNVNSNVNFNATSDVNSNVNFNVTSDVNSNVTSDLTAIANFNSTHSTNSTSIPTSLSNAIKNSIQDLNANANLSANLNANANANLNANSSANLNTNSNANLNANANLIIDPNSVFDAFKNSVLDATNFSTPKPPKTSKQKTTKKLKTDHSEPKTKASRKNGRANNRTNGRLNSLNNHLNLIGAQHGLLNGMNGQTGNLNVNQFDFLNGNHNHLNPYPQYGSQYATQMNLNGLNNATNQDVTANFLKFMNALTACNHLNQQQPQNNQNGLDTLANLGLHHPLNHCLNNRPSSTNQPSRPDTLNGNDKPLQQSKSAAESLNDQKHDNDKNASINHESNDQSNNRQCRSYLFDIRNNAVAQAIYKCTCCGKLTEYVDDAQSHYYDNHLNQDNQPSLINLPMQNFSNAYSRNFINLQGELSKMNNLTNGLNNHLNNLNNSRSHSNHQADLNLSRCLSRLSNRSTTSNHSSSSNSTGLINQNTNSQEQQIINNLLVERLSVGYAQNQNVYPNNGYSYYQNERQNNSDSCGGVCSLDGSIIGCTSPSLHLTGSPGRTKGESCTKTGVILCPVCTSSRFYTTLQRRYGHFTCVACYRFFKDFCKTPRNLGCPQLGKCALDTKQKCKACWLCACISIYNLDDKKRDVITRYPPINLSDFNNNEILNLDQEIHQEEDDDQLLASSSLNGILSPESDVDFESSSSSQALDFSKKDEFDKETPNGDMNNNNENNAPTNEFNVNNLVNGNQMNQTNNVGSNDLQKENDKSQQRQKPRNREITHNDLINFITSQSTTSLNTTTIANSNINFHNTAVASAPENQNTAPLNNAALMNATNLGLYSNLGSNLAQRQFTLDWNNNVSSIAGFENGVLPNLNYPNLNLLAPRKSVKRPGSSCNNCESCTQPDCDECRGCLNRINNIPNKRRKCVKKKCMNRKTVN